MSRTEDRADNRSELLLAGLHRWFLDVSDWDNLEPAQWNFLLSLLPEAESARVRRFVRENDRRLALGSRLLQRALVSKVFGVEFSEADIGRTTENKPYFAGMGRALLDGTASHQLRNWNFNVSHHGKYVAIASEPVCLCGIDVVDTAGRRRNEHDTAEDYLRYFTDQFSDKEWEAIRRTEDDEGRLRRFFLNWGLKESYVKAVGQGLGFNLRRISFLVGDWLDCRTICCWHSCCYCDPIRRNRKEKQHSDHQKSMTSDGITNHTRRCPEISARAAEGSTEIGAELVSGNTTVQEKEKGQAFQRSVCRVGVAEVEVDGVLRKNWSFRVFPLSDGYAACVARGPPSECSASGQAAGLIADPSVGVLGGGRGTRNLVENEDTMQDEMEQGLALPQLGFRKVRLGDIIPGEARPGFFSLGNKNDSENG